MRCGPPGKTTARKEDAESLFDAFDNVTSNDWSMPHSRPRLWGCCCKVGAVGRGCCCKLAF